MYRFYLAAVDMLPSAFLLIPLFGFLNMIYFHNTRKSILYFLLSCYLSVVYVLVGLPNITYIRPELNLNLVPFIGMIGDFKNSLLNILLFVPLGIAFPLLWREFRTQKNTVLLGFSVSLVIELLQLLTFRATDINDLITNTLGTHLGFICSKQLFGKYHPVADAKKREAVIVIAVVLIVMFFVYPFVSAALWNFILS